MSDLAKRRTVTHGWMGTALVLMFALFGFACMGISSLFPPGWFLPIGVRRLLLGSLSMQFLIVYYVSLEPFRVAGWAFLIVCCLFSTIKVRFRRQMLIILVPTLFNFLDCLWWTYGETYRYRYGTTQVWLEQVRDSMIGVHKLLCNSATVISLVILTSMLLLPGTKWNKAFITFFVLLALCYTDALSSLSL